MILKEFLNHKPLYYNEIDYDRFPKIYKKIQTHFQLPKIIHIVGTNAKGSTGRALAHLLHGKDCKVGHYSSPHILKFNERIWINGEDASDTLLEKTHQNLQELLDISDIEALSYFEYTTLLAMLLFCEYCDFVVLEAGLGGEYDATNVFPKDLSIVTPIGFDHEAFLGDTLTQIASTKLRSVNNDLLIARQYDNLVYFLALKRANKIKQDLYFAKSFLDDVFYENLQKFIEKNNYPSFFYDNFSTAFCAFKILGFEPNVDLLNDLKLFGRCQKIAPNITIDVGHNPMAAEAILEHFRTKKVILVYNSYNDKEYQKILSILKPIILKVEIIDIDNKREVQKSQLEAVLEDLNISYALFKKITPNQEYLVFGSFLVVEKFLQCQ